MKIPLTPLFLASFHLVCTVAASAQTPVIQDGDTVINDQELEYLVSLWTKQMRDVAIEDPGDRLELLNLSLSNKKVAQEADHIVQKNPNIAAKYQLGLERYQREFVLNWHRDQIELPEFAELAEEQYSIKRDKYAAVPEKRISSHILFMSAPGVPRGPVLAEAQEVLDQLRAGASFVEMVKLHSGEPGAAAKEGKFDKWLQYGEIGVSPPYTEGLFTIGEIGQYSELVQTQFGVHILRLDGIQEKFYKPFAEVKDAIIAELKAEYIKLEMKHYVGQFQLTGDAVIDNAAIDAILAPYAKKE
jgi:peptidyl-prolyl cis-trans isomerase C